MGRVVQGLGAKHGIGGCSREVGSVWRRLGASALALLLLTGPSLGQPQPTNTATISPPPPVPAVSGNPAATDFGITGTGWLGRALGLKDEWGVKLGGVWIAD